MKNQIKIILETEIKDKDLVYPFIAGLKKNEKTVLSLREQGFSLQEIGDKLYLTRERVRQIEAKAKAKIECQDKIIEDLAESLGKVLFVQEEVEDAFLKWRQVKNPNGDIVEIKNEWRDFYEFLNKIK